ncbi:phage tail protein [Escherichia fergusonii]|uniref:phage tail protein n=1 Tax=Escherichia fergusonii TaxID=564 RepID=UPI0015E4C822|nr:phage tail protein [Escherichia fergusonii]MBA8579615.1 phage tail protein [Escherichia fergusonii]QLM34277.1 phage tail protein [Escherichia fergusonii]HBJ0155534.1 phage tail protein [Escherichia coli]
MTVKYYAILTNQGAARLANATMLGSKLNLTQMAVGDANGVLPTPDPAQTKLINQKRIAPLNLLSVDPNNQSQIIAEQIIPENEGGFWIREIGLYDDEGVLIAVANCPETYKPQLQEGSGRTQTIRMILVVTNTEAITLKIDPSVVLATRKYVDDKISEHEQSRRHPDASLTAKGFTQLSSAINSESETLAATPKAVKAAYDLANGKYTAQNATTIQKGIVQLSSATNSTSETLAATPKAVKAVMDETNKKAPLNSPALTGTPTTPTAPQGTNSTQIASTAFVMAAIAALVDSSPDALNTLNELAAALGNDPNFATTMTNALAGKQPKDATLTALAELATSADKLPYFTGADRAALTALTSVGRAILGKTSTQGVLDYLGIGETGKYDILPASRGGTGASTIAGALINFGLSDLVTAGLVQVESGTDFITAKIPFLSGGRKRFLMIHAIKATMPANNNGYNLTVTFPTAYDNAPIPILGSTVGSTSTTGGTTESMNISSVTKSGCIISSAWQTWSEGPVYLLTIGGVAA